MLVSLVEESKGVYWWGIGEKLASLGQSRGRDLEKNDLIEFAPSFLSLSHPEYVNYD